MKNNHVIISSIAVWAGLALFCGCEQRKTATAPASRPAVLKIAVIPKATNHEYWKAIHAGAVKAERELSGVQIIWKGPPREDDREQQINVVDDFINAGVAGIVLAPLDETALLKPVQAAKNAGIPVVIMDSALKAQAGEDFASYVATDNAAGGRMAAEHMGKLLGGKGNVLVLRYQVGSGSTTAREEGFLAALQKDYPEIRLLAADQYAGATTAEAYSKAENLLQKYAEIDGIFGACEPVVFGILRALHGAGRAGKPKLVGFDRSYKLIQAMKAGEVHGLVLQDPVNMGYLAVKTVVAKIRGENMPPRIDTGCWLATPENMDEPRIRELLNPAIDNYLR